MKFDNNKYADIGKIQQFYGHDVTASLPTFHAITGCDTTSYFYGIGKTKF